MAGTRSPGALHHAEHGEPSPSLLPVTGTTAVIPAAQVGNLNLDGLNEHLDATTLCGSWEGVFSTHVGYTELGLLFRLMSM